MLVEPGDHHGGVLGHEAHSEEEDISQVVGLKGTAAGGNTELLSSNSQLIRTWVRQKDYLLGTGALATVSRKKGIEAWTFCLGDKRTTTLPPQARHT